MTSGRHTRGSDAQERLLLLAMYPLDRGLWGPTVRITHLRDELGAMINLDVIAGDRGARRVQLAHYVRRGRLRGLDAIYVESSTALPSETDIAFLGLARALGIPIMTYIRDAYQLFPEYYPTHGMGRWLATRLFLPAVRALSAVSTTVAVPTSGLARAVLGNAPAILLPPGSPAPVRVPLARGARDLLFVGSARAEAQGGTRLIAGVALARAHGSDVRLTMVTRPGEEPAGRLPDWVRVVRAEGRAIDGLLPNVIASVIPRPRNAYNDLALPVKLYDYLSFGRPLLVTNCRETARVVSEAGCGLIIEDDVDGIAEGVLRLLAMEPRARAKLGSSAHRAARENSWTRRAMEILRVLGLTGSV